MGHDEFDMCAQSYIHVSRFSLPEFLVKFSWIFFFLTVTVHSSKTRLVVAWPTASTAVWSLEGT